MIHPTVDRAEAAKRQILDRLAGVPGVRGIGLARLAEGGFCVKVNFANTPPEGLIPDDVDGVPVIIDVVGRISPT